MPKPSIWDERAQTRVHCHIRKEAGGPVGRRDLTAACESPWGGVTWTNKKAKGRSDVSFRSSSRPPRTQKNVASSVETF